MTAAAALAAPDHTTRMQTVRKQEDIALMIPEWRDLSVPGGKLELPMLVRKHVTLVGSGQNKQCIALVSRDSFPSLAYFKACDVAAKQGFVVMRHFVERSVLNLMLSEKVESETKEVTQDHQILLNRLMEEALERGASDVMLNHHGGSFESCFDVDTLAVKGQDYTVDEVHGMMRHLYQNLADSDSVDSTHFKSDTSQVAAADSFWSGKRTRIRFQSKTSFPGGIDFVLRLLDLSGSGGFLSYDDLHLPPQQIALMRRAMKKNTGGVFFCGATSSGKTTSIKVALEEKARLNPGLIIRSLEAPPEYIMPLIRQHAVQETKSGDLHVMSDEVKELMRMNPKYLFLGETRGPETGILCNDMLLSGHGLVSTLHTSGPFQAFDRLASKSIGVTKDVTTMTGNVNAMIYQCRLPTLCPHCSLTAKQAPSEQSPKDLLSRLSLVKSDMEQVRFQNPDGCEHCNYRGIKGSRVAMNAVQINKPMLDAVNAGDMNEFDHHWVERCTASEWGNAVETDLFHAVRMVLNGNVSPETLEEEFNELDPTMLKERCRTWSENKGFACEF